MFELPPIPAPDEREQLRLRLVRYILPFIELGDEAGVDVDGLLAAVGLSRRALHSPMTQLPCYQIHWLVEQLTALSGDPEIGLRAAERMSFTQSAFLGDLVRHCVQASSDLFTVMQLLGHFGTYVARTWRITLRVDGDVVNSAIVSVVAMPPALNDWMAAACCSLTETLGGAGLRPLEVRLPRPRPQAPERYESFFGSPVQFDAPQLETVYALEALRRPVRAASTTHAAPSAALVARSGNALALQIRRHLLTGLAEGVPLLASVARNLGLSARTLRRRLSEVRSSYAELVDDARRERALALVRRPEIDVGRLAELTGFTDASSFTRAFRRWTGERPGEYMRRTRDSAQT